jgi:hypothetical protein
MCQAQADESVKLSLCLISVGDWRCSSTSALDGGEWSASRPGRFTPGERTPGTHWIEVWVGTEPVWTLWSKEKYIVPAGN